MLRWSLGFLIVALIAGLFGFTPMAGACSEAAKIVCFGSLVLFVASLLFDNRSYRDIV